MKDDKRDADMPIELDASELLGLSQIAKVAAVPTKPSELGRTFSKAGVENPDRSEIGRLLSKVGGGSETPGG